MAERLMWNFDWLPVVFGNEQWFWSARARGALQAYVSEGFDLEAFARRHVEQRSWLGSDIERSEQGRAGASDDGLRFMCAHRAGLSWVDASDDVMRIVVADSAERTIVLDARDLQMMLDRPPLPPMTLRLWREASTNLERAQDIRGESVAGAFGLLLDELERYSVRELFERNEIPLSKFL